MIIAGCDNIPADPGQTLNQIQQTGQLRVGVSDRPPWTVSPLGTGVEEELLKHWAEQNQVKVIWREGSERDLVEFLEQGEIDVAIAGFTDDTPWSERAAMTRPYLERPDGKHVMLVPKGENRWLLELDRFLQRRRQETRKMVMERSDT